MAARVGGHRQDAEQLVTTALAATTLPAAGPGPGPGCGGAVASSPCRVGIQALEMRAGPRGHRSDSDSMVLSGPRRHRPPPATSGEFPVPGGGTLAGPRASAAWAHSPAPWRSGPPVAAPTAEPPTATTGRGAVLTPTTAAAPAEATAASATLARTGRRPGGRPERGWSAGPGTIGIVGTSLEPPQPPSNNGPKRPACYYCPSHW